MKTIILFILFATPVLSQDLNYLKSQDTVYIVLKDMKEFAFKKLEFKKFNFESEGNGKLNQYNLIDSINRRISIIVPKDIKEPVSDRSINVKRKKILKKNNARIITLDFIKQYYPDELFFNYLGLTTTKMHKVIYIIDEDSYNRKDRNLSLRKAFIEAWSYSEF